MKKLIALTLAGVMVFSLPVLAYGSPTAEAVVSSSAPAAPSTPSSNDGFPAAVVAAAAAEGKTVGEYLNNVVVSVPGLENLIPIGQGGHVIINGAPSNQVFTVAKPTTETVTSAKEQAEALGGTILNVVNIKASVRNFETARVNFYMKGVTAGQKIKVYYLVDGEWAELEVAEIREDHVVVDMIGLGALLFVEVPAVPAV